MATSDTPVYVLYPHEKNTEKGVAECHKKIVINHESLKIYSGTVKSKYPGKRF